VRPDIAKEWDYKRNIEMGPEDVTINSAKQVYWVCPKGHPSYKKSVASRALHGSGCPVCKSLMQADRVRNERVLEKKKSKTRD
jgi:hypothetical protein